MARATRAEKARLLNAAYRLLGPEIKRAEATRHLGREFALARRQAYRYLLEAAGLGDPVPAVEPTVAISCWCSRGSVTMHRLLTRLRASAEMLDILER